MEDLRVKKLTPKAKKFLRLVWNGMSHIDAYIKVYNTTNKQTASTQAHRITSSEVGKAYIAKLSEKIDEKAILAKEDLLEELADIIYDDETTAKDKMTGIKLAMDALGYSKPQQVEMEVKTITMKRV